MLEEDLIVGSGGGGKSRKPKEAKDNLDSTQNVTLIDLISEGEIQGLKDGFKSVFLDNTPLQNPDGSMNFENVQIFTTTGTQNQAPIPIAPQIEDEKGVLTTVTTDFPITRTVTDTNVDAVRVTISVPQLQRFTDKGDIVGSEVRLRIQVQYNGGGFSTVVDDTIKGRTPDLYQRDYQINLTGAFPVDIRVVRVTPDSTSSKLLNEFSWASYTEITFAKLNYPNSALVAIRTDAEQFSRVPGRSYLVRGIKVRIPNNATVDQTNGRVIYTGIWNGTFGAAQWCSDPAWILWDLLTSKRYGFGAQIDASQLDRWAFYAASQYCSQLVPNGFGGQEPRFTCNVNIQTPTEAYKLVSDMCSVFRAMPYWTTGSLALSQDRPADPAYLFTLANVSVEGFSYSTSSFKGRPTVAVVGYLDTTQRDTAYEVVEDYDGIAKYGVTTTEITAFACTSRGQAARLGRWLLYTEREEDEVVTFTASIDAGAIVRPGQVIEISDPMRAGSRRGGRVTAVASSSILTIDSAEGIPGAGTLSVIMPDGSLETRTVIGRNGAVFTVSPAFSQPPKVNTVWIHQSSDLQTSLWRVLAIQEQEGANYSVTALSYNPSKYAFIENGTPLQFRDVTNLNVIPEAPKKIDATEVLYESNGLALTKIIVSWQQVIGVKDYRIRWRVSAGNWSTATIQRTDFEILDTQIARYEIEVYSLNAALRQSVQPAILFYDAQGRSAPPQDVTGLSLVPVDQATAIISWDRSTDLDVVLGGKVLIRHTVELQNPDWTRAQEIVAAAAGGQTQKVVPLLEGSYMLKFEDSSGNRSRNATTARTDLPTPQPRLSVKRYAEDQEIFNGQLAYRWFATDGSNPDTKEAFDALFLGDAQGNGLHVGSVDWTTPPAYLPSSSFAWEVAGSLIINTAGDYVFQTVSDDGNELMVDGEIVTSFYGGRAAGTDTSATVTLAAGVYSFRYRMQQGGGGAAARVLWQTPGSGSFVVIPASALRAGPFIGMPTNMVYNDEFDALILDSDPETNQVFMQGEYNFGSDYDLGGVYDINLRRRLVTRPFVPNDLWDDRTELIDNWGDVDGEFPDGVLARLYVRHTNDDPAAGPVWSEWREFANAIVRGRAFQFKLVAMTDDPFENILVDELGLEMELQQRVDRGGPLFSSGADFLVTFNSPFIETPTVGLTAFNLGSTDTFEISDVTRSSFRVTFRNVDGDPVSRQFTYTAVGFGREII